MHVKLQSKIKMLKFKRLKRSKFHFSLYFWLDFHFRLEEVLKSEANYEKKLADYYASQVQAETEKSEQEKVMERRIREIQEYFGYWIDPNDPRFEVMLKQKEAEEKKVSLSKIGSKNTCQKKPVDFNLFWQGHVWWWFFNLEKKIINC